jgi:hypothetical protein
MGDKFCATEECITAIYNQQPAMDDHLYAAEGNLIALFDQQGKVIMLKVFLFHYCPK